MRSSRTSARRMWSIGSFEEEFEDECEEDVVNRQLLKKQSGSILERATKKQTKKRGRMVESDAVVESAAGETKDRP